MSFLRKIFGGTPLEDEAVEPFPAERLQRLRGRIEDHEALAASYGNADAGEDWDSPDELPALPPEPPVDVAAAVPPPPPVVLARKPRERDRDWSQDRSWFGGLPRLGDAAWPRGKDGTPLPFVAQIDLAELFAACPESPLSQQGSLAFFINEGAVVYVPEGDHPQSEPPAGLPPAYDEDGYPLPQRAGHATRPLFPFWPVEMIGLPLPETQRAYPDEEQHEAIWEAQNALLAERVPRRQYAFSVYSARKEGIEGADDLWWYAVHHLIAKLHDALEGAPRLIAMRADTRDQASAQLQKLEADPRSTDGAKAAARAAYERALAGVEEREKQARDLPDFIAALENLAAGRDPWARLTEEELAAVRDTLKALRNDFKDLVRFHVPHSTDDLATLCVRRMITGDAEALAALPEGMLRFLNHGYRLTSCQPHQVFGLAGVVQENLYNHLDDLLLLQVAYDDLNEWRFGDMGLWHFWISPADAAAGRWDKAKLTFECS